MASSSNQEFESRGTTVEAAITAGLQRMGLEREQVKVIVIDEGSRGLLGIGSREAIVRLIATPAEPVVPPPPVVTKPADPPRPVTPEPPKVTPRPAPAPEPKPKQEARPVPPVSSTEEDDETSPADSAENLESERETAVEIITTLLEKMKVSGRVIAHVTEPDDLTGQRVNIIDISGEDLGVLIGPRGETLDSLQYLSRLMVSHKLHRRANFVVDVEGFRQRREQALTRLAERMADKVRQRGEPIGLEPMSAYERRIVHMTLRDATDVYTESTGEGRQRRVRIIPKQ